MDLFEAYQLANKCERYNKKNLKEEWSLNTITSDDLEEAVNHDNYDHHEAETQAILDKHKALRNKTNEDFKDDFSYDQMLNDFYDFMDKWTDYIGDESDLIDLYNTYFQ